MWQHTWQSMWYKNNILFWILTMSIFSITTYYYGQYIKSLYETLWTKFKSRPEQLILPRTRRLGENRYWNIFLWLVIGIESFFFFGCIKFKARKWNSKLPLKKNLVLHYWLKRLTQSLELGAFACTKLQQQVVFEKISQCIHDWKG